ncbi:5'-bis(diphosphate) 3'-pyrophosphohydrolase MESH1 (HD domain-containing protein 3) (Metazoan SpoT homolog 1) (MESH1) (Penta-phosphate guanosine-3'-pyrophosphohydrolase) ((ppGpp)ase) [Durusdinium trenchii]|uniref:Guanosine-3',5'-bis(diphosphate) 3'-pyrophosphohydrolase MESH1 n=1 Tax=Durusdinium trenchii TaxID=1381693 RepID=A0ABP0JWJ1_9DINO
MFLVLFWRLFWQDSQVAEGPLAAARRLVDASYHGHYTLERQRFQDTLVRRLVELNGHGAPLREPRLVFTAGAMGVGKSHVIRWLAEKGILPMPLGRVESTRTKKDFVHINPDHLAAQLPEYMGYMEHNRACAAVMTRLEAGLLTELSCLPWAMGHLEHAQVQGVAAGLMYALQQKRNILVDSSLRHGSWYSRVLQKIRQKLPEVRVVLMYVHAHEETIYERANQRGLEGRMVSHVEVADSLEKIPLAIQKLLPYMDTFIQVDNDGHEPELTSVCQQPREDLDAYCEVDPDPSSMGFGWKSVKDILHTDLEPGEALLEPPEILPSAATEPQPLAALFRTSVPGNPQRTPYINHPLAVARILAEVGIRDLKTLQAALLHDTLEDTEATRAELEAAFGAEVANLVHALTDEEGLRPLHQKFRQLRRVKSLPLKAKLVRIADKLHNVWDIMHHGIPGWSKGKTERYVAWACEMVDALRGTHTALEQRFHSEVSLPKGYQLGDWQEFAVQEMGWALLEERVESHR